MLDVGLKRTSTGARVFGAMKGASDGGIFVPHSESRFPGFDVETKELEAEVLRKYIFGGHVAEYMETLADDDEERYKSQFQQYLDDGIEGMIIPRLIFLPFLARLTWGNSRWSRGNVPSGPRQDPREPKPREPGKGHQGQGALEGRKQQVPSAQDRTRGEAEERPEEDRCCALIDFLVRRYRGKGKKKLGFFSFFFSCV